MNQIEPNLIEKRERLQTMLTILYNEAYLVEPLLADAIMEVVNFQWAFVEELTSTLNDEWAEQIIEKKAWEVVDSCEKDNEIIYKEFIAELHKLKSFIPEERFCMLEDLFVQKFYGFRVAFRTGVDTGRGIERLFIRLALKRPT